MPRVRQERSAGGGQCASTSAPVSGGGAGALARSYRFGLCSSLADEGTRLTLRNEPAFDVTHLGSPVAEPLSRMEVMIEANRCLDCYDAPCIAACPTSIDIPSFIKKIATGNMTGSARTILDANPLGASCARVCPTAE